MTNLASAGSGAGMDRPKISVVLPMYNAGEFLPACLDSLLAQSMDDFEIVAVDDASTDQTGDIIAAYAARDRRVRSFRNEQNVNSFETRLTALQLITGDYVFCCDADDLVPPMAFRLLLDEAAATGADIVHGRSLLLSPKGAEDVAYWVEPFKVRTGRDFTLAMLRNRRGWNVWAKLFRRRVVERSLALFPRGRHWFTLDDLLTSCLFGLHADQYAALKVPVYHYRIPPVTHAIRSGGFAKWAGDSLGIMTYLEEIVGRQQDGDPLRKAVRVFMENCLSEALAQSSAEPEAFQRVVEKIRTTVPAPYVKWAEERGMFSLNGGEQEGKASRLLKGARGALQRLGERGLRESYLRYRTKLVFWRWEREYQAARSLEQAAKK